MNRKILVGLITILLAFTLLISPASAINHYSGGNWTPDKTFSGINLRGYHWVCYCIDDWGGGSFGKNANLTEERYFESQGTYPIHGPTLGYWENGTLESEQDMQNLFTVLEKHPDMPLTPMFVMEFMNGTAMQANGFTQWVGIPINKTGWIEETKFNSSGSNSRGDPTAAYLDGYNRDLWLPEYHGLTHVDADWILENCTDGNATAIDDVVNHDTYPRIMNGTTPVGIFLPGNEYINNYFLTLELGEGNKTVAQCQALLNKGTQEFYNLFGYWPEASTPPGYGCSNETMAAFRNTSIYGVGSLGSWRTPTYGALNYIWTDYSYFNGLSTVFPLFYISSHYSTDVAMYMNYINLYFSSGEPVVIQDHYVWYTCSEIRNTTEPGGLSDSLKFLDDWMTAIKTTYPDVWFLTAPELHQLNIRGYSIQNWTDKIVVRNALPQRSITIHIPSTYDIRHLEIKDAQSHLRSYTWNEAQRTVRITVPHNETFTIRQGGIPAIRHFLTDDAPYLTSFVPFLMLIVIIFTACVAILTYVKKGG